jgi:hypothetical protein
MLGAIFGTAASIAGNLAIIVKLKVNIFRI